MGSKHYHVFVSPAADRKLAIHIEFLARVSEKAATRLYEDYKAAIGFLEGSPQSCPLYIPKISIDAELRYKLIGNRYRVVFEIVENSVFVYDVQDCRQNIDKNLI